MANEGGAPMTSNKYPLFLELPEVGNAEAMALIEKFKAQMVGAVTQTVGDFYCNIMPHIETDAWTNYRNDLMEGFKNYNNRLVLGEHNFKEIRQAIYAEYREDIIKDLDQDNLERIAELERENERLRDAARRDMRWG
jgi:hypothetical protein